MLSSLLIASQTILLKPDEQCVMGRSRGTGVEISDGYNVQMVIDENDASQVVITVHMVDYSWMGLVLGSGGMGAGSDMIQIVADNTSSRIYDKKSIGYITPIEDPNKDITGTYRLFEDGSARFTIYRKFDTKDENDFVMPIGDEFTLGYAINTSSNKQSSKHNKAGSTTVTIPQDGTSAFLAQDLGAI